MSSSKSIHHAQKHNLVAVTVYGTICENISGEILRDLRNICENISAEILQDRKNIPENISAEIL